MHAAASSHADPWKDATPSANPPCCPLYNGPLVPLRGAYRCSRCFFTLCVGCDTADDCDRAAGE